MHADPANDQAHRALKRFEHPAPNDLWQMDFKGHFALTNGGRCHPLTVLDDHSRYSAVCRPAPTSRPRRCGGISTAAFERYGLPHRMLSDNGSPWGTSGQCIEGSVDGADGMAAAAGHWAIHGQPHHPLTQGKEERLHATLVSDLLRWQAMADLDDAQQHFRETYNHIRPHEALGMSCPGQRFTVSPRSYPRVLPVVEYKNGDVVRQVNKNGRIQFDGQLYAIGKPFLGQPVALSADAAGRPVGGVLLPPVNRLDRPTGRPDIRCGTLTRRAREGPARGVNFDNCVTYVPAQVLPMSST